MLGLSAIVVLRLADIETSVKTVTRTLAPEANESTEQMQNILQRNTLVQKYLQTGDETFVEEFQSLQLAAIAIADKLKTINEREEHNESELHASLLDEITQRDENYSRIFLRDVVENHDVSLATASSMLEKHGPHIVQALTDTTALALADDNQVAASASTEALQNFQAARIYVGQYILNNAAADASRVEMQLLAVDNAFYDMAETIEDPRQIALAQDAKHAFDLFVSDFSRIVDAVDSRNQAVSGPMAAESQAILKLAHDQRSSVWNSLDHSGEQVEQTVTSTVSTVAFTAAVALILALVPAFLVTRNIKRAINNTVSAAEGIANGELDQNIQIKSKDETGQLLTALDTMIDRLTEVVGGIQSAAGTVKSGASDISVGNQDLSISTEKQVKSLGAVATEIEQLTTAVKQNTEYAVKANKLAQAARTSAEDSSEVVASTVSAMLDINNASKEIFSIIDVIDEIAFQTNLLALNASVEAARAGESGRGFAVVASEVQNLAGRSSEAANEIKELITDSNQKVEHGTTLVNRSHDTLDEIVNTVAKVSDVVSEIAAASEQQSTGIVSVNQKIQLMKESFYEMLQKHQ